MKIHIITIFPESFRSYIETSIIGRAIRTGLIEIFFYKLNDYSQKKFKQIDDKAYGMHGQVISAEPLSIAINNIFSKLGKTLPIVYMTPSGQKLNQELVEKYYQEFSEEFIIICGHYEGIDQRIIDLYIDYEISIGDYIITSGELSSMVFIDSLARHIPGVLGNTDSLLEESFSKKLNRQKEYPVYTRPQEFEGLKVPDVLISGNHAEIKKWKFNNLR